MGSNIRELLRTRFGMLCSHLWLVFSFGFLDAWLRVVTRWIGAYSIYELEPNLFALLWAIVLTALVTAPKTRKTGRLLYGILYAVFMMYALVQYGAYLALGKFLYISDFLYAGEGTQYMSWVINLLSLNFLLQALLLILIGIIGILIYPVCDEDRSKRTKHLLLRGSAAILCVVAISQVPKMYGDVDGVHFWNQAFEYEQFSNVNYDMELTGMYQFLVRDATVQLQRGKNCEEDIRLVQAFFEKKAEHEENSLTGIFAGKNLIVVMMETIDDWMVDPEHTPTIWYMMQNGIRFTDFYTPQYSNGYTFNTEFAFNTGVYPYTNGNIAYFPLNNDFRNSIGNLMARVGYKVDSYHEENPDYYNRGTMHKLWGYSQYHSYRSYGYEDGNYLVDTYLVECDALYEALTADAPFFSFVITYSPHLPYIAAEEVCAIALEKYPQYDKESEVSILRAKGRLTDDMFAGLLERLEEDGLLEDTVIVGFGDHYSYGLSDREQLQQISLDAGCAILERTPAFIYCAGSDIAMEVDKVMQITDLAPTILNLFGIEVPKEIMGSDIFDPRYDGHVIFANGGWLTDTAYMKDGALVWNNGMTDAEIAEMNAYVQQVFQVNDAILDANYYAYLQDD